MRFGEGSIAARSAATPYVAYLPCESSVRVPTRISHAKCGEQKRPGRPCKGQPGPRFPYDLLLDDPDLDLGMDVGVQSDGNAIDSEGPDRLVQVDLALLDWESLRLELMRNVR